MKLRAFAATGQVQVIAIDLGARLVAISRYRPITSEIERMGTPKVHSDNPPHFELLTGDAERHLSRGSRSCGWRDHERGPKERGDEHYRESEALREQPSWRRQKVGRWWLR